MTAFSSNLNLPIRKGAVRFAVGPPDGTTSNSWKCWVGKNGDVYIICRDNLKDAKVSLHASGRWRMAFEERVRTKYPGLIATERNRAWQVWDEPPAQLPETVIAFRLFFLTSELGVSPAQRSPKEWNKVIFIEAAPVGSGKMVVASLFVTVGEKILRHESEPSLWLASLDIGRGRRAQLVVHGEPEGEYPELINRGATEGRAQAERAGVILPPESYGYFLGASLEGWHFLVAARAHRKP